MTEPGEFAAVACNVARETGAAAARARCYVLGVPGSADSASLLIRSRSGRWIEKWERTKLLANVRVVTMVPDNPVAGRLPRLSRETADKLVERIATIQERLGKP